jgi:transcriptional regulator with XRE-family HTH domain
VTRSPIDSGPLAAAVRICRLRRGLSQEAVAARAGVDRTYVQKIEKATKHPSFATVALLLDALDVRWAEFGAIVDLEMQRRRAIRDTTHHAP